MNAEYVQKNYLHAENALKKCMCMLSVRLQFFWVQSVHLKVMANENWGGSKLVSVDLFWWTVLLASVLFKAPIDTITRGAKTFSASLANFGTVQTCWVSNISQRSNLNAWGFYVAASVVVKKSQELIMRLFWPSNQRQRLLFVSQWEHSSDDENVQN